MDSQFPDVLLKQLEKERIAGGPDVIINPKLPPGFRFPNMNPHLARKGAVLILFYQKGPDWYFPLIQRPTYDGVHSGQVAFPGGRMEDGDENLIRTALRESREEIGVEEQDVNVVGELSHFFVSASNHLVKPVIGFHRAIPQFVPDNREVEVVIEAPLTELLSQAVTMKEVHTSRGYSITSASFLFDNRVVWGATAMMLAELKRILT